MSIRAFHNESTLGAHRFLKSNSKVEELNKQVADSTRLHIASDDVVDYKVSKSYVKTWYHSDWDIKKIDEKNENISIVKKSYQGILTGFLGYSQLRGKNVSSLIKERLHISIIFGLSGFFLSYLVHEL